MTIETRPTVPALLVGGPHDGVRVDVVTHPHNDKPSDIIRLHDGTDYERTKTQTDGVWRYVVVGR